MNAPAARANWFDRIAGDVESFTLQERLLNLFSALAVALIVSIVIPMNAALGLGLGTQLFSFGVAAIFGAVFYLLRVRRTWTWIGLPVLALTSMSLGAYYVMADGMDGPALLFLLVSAFVVISASQGRTRLVLIAAHVLFVCGLVGLEVQRPDLVERVYEDVESRGIDLASSWAVALLSLLGFGLAMQRGYNELVRRLGEERQRADDLLQNVLPVAVAAQLKSSPGTIADLHEEVTVLFADLVGFTQLASTVRPEELIRLLDGLFREFDEVASRHGLEKIKTIGDAYMAAAGVPDEVDDHPDRAVAAALDLLEVVEGFDFAGRKLQLRIGLHSGPVVAGVIGSLRLAYDLWGDTVNTASRMESHGLPGAVQLSQATADRLERDWTLEPRGEVKVKGKGQMRTWVVRRG